MASQLQHYIPRFILRRFTTAPKDTVHVYDKHTGKCFVAGTGKIAAEKGLYDFDIDGESLTLEQGLAEIEGRAASHIEQILKDERLHLSTPMERGELSRFFALQFVRTPAHAQMCRDIDARMEAWLRQQGMSEDFFAVDPRLGSRENAERVFSAKTLIDAPNNFGPAFAAKDWLLMSTDPLYPYLIGDHPLVMHNTRDLGPRGNLGLNVEGIEIYFPLSPTLTLGMICYSHRRDFQQALQRMSPAQRNDPGRQRGLSIARDFVDSGHSGEPVRMEREYVDFLNSLQVARAERFLFSSAGNFSLAEKMIADHPHLRRGARVEEATGKL